MIAPIINDIPTTLIEQPRWLLWREVERKGKKTKEPRTARNTLASSTDPTTWDQFSVVTDTLGKAPSLFDGFGIVLGSIGTDEHFCGIDFDSCLNEDGAIADWAEAIVIALPTYAEVSPSETGLKAFFRCKAADATALRDAFGIGGKRWGAKRTVGLLNGKDHGPAVEVYLGPGRYFTVTGKHWPSSPEDVALLDRATLLHVAELVQKATAAPTPTPESKPKPSPPGRDNSRSAVAFRLAAKLYREDASLTFDQMCKALREHPDTAEWCRDKGDANDARELRNIWAKISTALVLSPASPLNSAREWLRRHFTVNDVPTLQHQQSAFYYWAGSSYIEMPHESMRSGAYAFLDRAHIATKDDGLVPFHPNQKSVNNIIDAVAAASQLPVNTRAPAWLDDGPHADPSEVLAFTNGQLHVPTRRMRPHTPLFFNLNAVDYAYDPKAPAPAQWLGFLGTLWENDQESIDTLQELFGLLLTTNTAHQKAFLLVGPKRCGKGTIARILSAMLGRANVAGPTLSSLADRFGIAPLIGKPLAIVSDARLSGRTDPSIIAERILSITGEDAITVDRKNRDCWHGTLPTRFIILTNELPKLTDASGALTSRFIVLHLTVSFIGREDMALTGRLLEELPGILNWALTGYVRLRDRGHFIQPATAKSVIRQMEDLGSPISAFLRDRCNTGPRYSIGVNDLFEAWRAWCIDQNRDHAGTKGHFGKDLHTALPGLSVSQETDEATRQRHRYYNGIALQ